LNKHCYGPGEGPVEFSGGYFQVPHLVFDLKLTANEKLVLIYFMRRADRAGRSFPSVERICRDCGFGSKNTALKAINSLVKAGLIRRKPVPGRSHDYFVSRELCRVIEEAKERYAGRVNKTSPTCSEYEHPCSNNEPPGVQILNPKEYTVEGSTGNEYTEKQEARKKRKRALEEARASSSFHAPADYDDDNKITMLDVAEHMHSLTQREKREFDREALRFQLPGEPDPSESLWQRRMLRVRYLRQLREGGG
jgi:DNA-binding MarR family transcriptional regulator